MNGPPSNDAMRAACNTMSRSQQFAPSVHRQPCDGRKCCAPGRVAGRVRLARKIADGRPRTLILDVSTEFLKSKCAIGSAEQIDTPVVSSVLDTLEHQPARVDAPRHDRFRHRSPAGRRVAYD